MRKILTTRYAGKFNELTVKQQEKILDKNRYINVDHDWYSFTFEDVKQCLKLLGFYDVEIEFSGFWSQGHGASFTGFFSVPQTVKELKERIRKFKEFAPKDELCGYDTLRFNKEEKENERLEVYRISRHYSHSNTVTCDHEGLKEFARSFSNGIYKRLEKEYEYLTSDVIVKETLEANDYEFYTDTLEIVTV